MWTYDPTDLGTDTPTGRINSVRLLLGDTNESDQQVQDEEIDFALSENGSNVYYAAAWAARTVASKYSRFVDTDLDGQLSESFSQLQTHYRDLADRMEYLGKKSGGSLGVAAGGLSIGEMQIARDNTNRVQPRIKRDQFREDPDYYDLT